MPTDKRGLDLLEYAVEIARGQKADRLDAGALVEVLGGRHTDFPAEDLAGAFSDVVAQAESLVARQAPAAGLAASDFRALAALRDMSDAMSASAEKNLGDVYAVVSSIGGPRDAKAGVCFCRAIERPLAAALRERDELLGAPGESDPGQVTAPRAQPLPRPQDGVVRPAAAPVPPADPAGREVTASPSPASSGQERKSAPILRRVVPDAPVQGTTQRQKAAPDRSAVASRVPDPALDDAPAPEAAPQRRIVRLSADARPDITLPQDFRGLDVTVGDAVFNRGAERTVELIGAGCLAYKNESGQLTLVDSDEVRRIVPDTIEILNQDASLPADRYAYFWGIKAAGPGDEVLEEDVRRHLMNRALKFGQSMRS